MGRTLDGKKREMLVALLVLRSSEHTGGEIKKIEMNII